MNNNDSIFDIVILGAGIYGAYIAKKFAEQGKLVCLIEADKEAFTRASYINQARVHNGYHYPRSFSTAIKSAQYFERFNQEFDFAINKEFKKIYAISSAYSMTSGDQFESFCKYSNIPCIKINSDILFQKGMIDGAYETLEYSFDSFRIRDFLMDSLSSSKNVTLKFGKYFSGVEKHTHYYGLTFLDGDTIRGKHIINCTYASTNQILDKFGLEKFDIKYELAELILCKTSGLDGYGVTVMDGPFFSLMPFGIGSTYSLTSVTHTPRLSTYDNMPKFPCQKNNTQCTSDNLQNCNSCHAQPKTAFSYMNQMVKKYMNDSITVEYEKSLFAIKPLLKVSELDDSRPTIVKTYGEGPYFTTVFSGKINTMYDLDVLLSEYNL